MLRDRERESEKRGGGRDRDVVPGALPSSAGHS